MPGRIVFAFKLPAADDVELAIEHRRIVRRARLRQRRQILPRFGGGIERGHGGFSRTFHLPVPVDSEQVTADLRDGVLTVICPKAADGSARRIQVS